MTYRSDLDAALARLDALEQENRQLVDENARLRAPVVARQLTPPVTQPPQAEVIAPARELEALPDHAYYAPVLLIAVALLLIFGVGLVFGMANGH